MIDEMTAPRAYLCNKLKRKRRQLRRFIRKPYRSVQLVSAPNGRKKRATLRATFELAHRRVPYLWVCKRFSVSPIPATTLAKTGLPAVLDFLPIPIRI